MRVKAPLPSSWLYRFAPALLSGTRNIRTKLGAMTVHREGLKARGSRRSRTASAGGARATIVFFLWVLLILDQAASFSFAVHDKEESSASTTAKLLKSSSSSFSSVPRKAQFFHTHSGSFHAPSPNNHAAAAQPSASNTEGVQGDPADTVYAEDKRIIHTGPNPLHN